MLSKRSLRDETLKNRKGFAVVEFAFSKLTLCFLVTCVMLVLSWDCV